MAPGAGQHDAPDFADGSRDIARGVARALSQHPAIEQVQLVGSRARGDSTQFSDWDFEVATRQFRSVARALPSLVRPLRPLAQQWDRLSRHQTYMLVLRGPEKVDLLFGRSHEREGPWTVTKKTLPAIDNHFWDWLLWLLSKEAAGRSEVVQAELETMFAHILEPMGSRQPPVGIDEAMSGYLEARTRQEHINGVLVSRRLEDEVLKAFRQRGPMRGAATAYLRSSNLRDSAIGHPRGAGGEDPAAPSIEIRTATGQDVAVAARILEEAIAWSAQREFDSWAPGEFARPEGRGRERLMEALEAGGLYLIFVDGQPVGTMSLLPEDPVFWPESTTLALYLHRFAIRGSHTGRGLGAAALAWAEHEVRRQGRRLLRLDCLADHPGIRAYYERKGFEHQDDVEVHGIRFSRYEFVVERTPRTTGSSSDVGA